MEKAKYKLRIIGEEEYFYSDLRTALECQSMAQMRGKVALLMRYDESTDDYTIAL